MPQSVELSHQEDLIADNAVLKKRGEMGEIVQIEKISNRIFQIRSRNVMLDEDLASLYGVETKQLTRALGILTESCIPK